VNDDAVGHRRTDARQLLKHVGRRAVHVDEAGAKPRRDIVTRTHVLGFEPRGALGVPARRTDPVVREHRCSEDCTMNRGARTSASPRDAHPRCRLAGSDPRVREVVGQRREEDAIAVRARDQRGEGDEAEQGMCDTR